MADGDGLDHQKGIPKIRLLDGHLARWRGDAPAALYE